MNGKKAILISFCAGIISLTSMSIQANQAKKIYINNVATDLEYISVNNIKYLPITAFEQSNFIDIKSDSYGSICINMNGYDQVIPEIVKYTNKSIVGLAGYYNTPNATALSERKIISATGTIIKQTGEILTNAHFTNQAEDLTVFLNDGSILSGTVLYSDNMMDLAVIKINRNNLSPIKFGDIEKIKQGEGVIALGNSLTFSSKSSVSAGIISGLAKVSGYPYQFIQTDTAINVGNSGGPLVNLKGELIGINSLKYSGIGIEGMGFSIPIDTIKYAIENFDQYGKVVRPTIGMTLIENDENKTNIIAKPGLEVTGTQPSMPAAKAGVLAGDNVLSINGIKIYDMIDYNEQLKKLAYDSHINLLIERGKETLEISVKPIFLYAEKE